MMLLWVLVAVVAVVMGYIRLAPSDPVIWHRMPDNSAGKPPADKNFKNGAIRLVVAGDDGLGRLDAIAMATPRTTRLSGSVAEGMVTYVTRSAMLGFPDYATVRQDGTQLVIYARSRFGRSDLGVNGKRVQGWIDALQAR